MTDRAEYMRQYYAKNREKLLQRTKDWKHEHQEQSKEYNKRRYSERREEFIERSKQWALENPEKARERVKAWRERNPGKVYESQKTWKKENAEKLKEWCRRYKANNPDKISEYNKQYRKENPDVSRVHCENRRARINGNGGRFTKRDVARLQETQNGRCAACRVDLNKTGFHVDHVMPLVLGGTNDPENLQLLCPTCNHRKKDMHPDAWAQRIGKLFV